MDVHLLSRLILSDNNPFVFLTCAEGRTVINIGSLPKGAVSATHIMVITAQDHWCLPGTGRVYQSVVSTRLAGVRQRIKVGLLQVPFGFFPLEDRPTLRNDRIKG